MSVESTSDNLSFTYSELKALSDIYASEFNQPTLHDRVLVLDIYDDDTKQNAVATPITTISEATEDKPPKSLEQDLEEGTEGSTEERGATSTPTGQLLGKRSQEDNVISPVDNKRLKVLSSWDFTKYETQDEVSEPTHSEDKNEENFDTNTESENSLITNPDASSPFQDYFSDREILRQRKIFVHTSWLAVHSSYFRSLFYSGLSESHLKEVHLKISECEEKGHLLLLEAMYRPDILNEAGVDDLLVVLELADKYQVKFVFTKCKNVLKANATTIENCEKIMRYVLKLKHNRRALRDLKITLRAFLVKTFSPLDETWQTEAFAKLSVGMIVCLLGKGTALTVQSENTVFHALMHWIKCCNTRDKHLYSHIQYTALHLVGLIVQFEYLTVDYLHNVVQHHPIVSKMTGFMEYYTRGVTYHAMKLDARNCLQVKPVPRPTVQLGTIVQYWWTLPKTQVDNLPSEAKLTSDKFWSCGYKMQMALKKLEDSSQFVYNIGINFQFLELRKESFVALKWKIRCESIVGCEGLGEHTRDNAYSFLSKCCKCPYGVYAVRKTATDKHSYKIGLVIQLL